jgi:hypothetical protein
MRDAVEAWQKENLEKEGYSTQIPPGAWGDSPKLRGSAVHYTEEFKECVVL